MRLRSRVFIAVVAVGVTAGVLAVVIPGDEGSQPHDAARPAQGDQAPQGAQAGTRQPRFRDTSRPPGQTSEGIVGEMVEPMPHARLGRGVVSHRQGWRVAPGVHYRRWDHRNRRDRVRAHLLTVNLNRPGVSVDYASGRFVPNRRPLTALLSRDNAVAGINGGFFDIHDTGAPLGIGRDRQRGMLHASRLTWNNAFSIGRGGMPRIRQRLVNARIKQLPTLQLTNVNSPRVRPGSVGIYAPAWGRTYGYRITDGQTRHVRMVVVRHGKVVVNRPRLDSGRRIVGGVVLIGRGPGADALRKLRVGSMATVQWHLPGRPPVAISGESILLLDRKLQVTDDREMHPRTAIGIDRDTRRLLLLVIDGRQSFSRGFTLVELARTLRRLGAEDALNFDGGGSSTMAGEGRRGRVRVLNSPSDGSQRSIPDGLAILYRKPAAAR